METCLRVNLSKWRSNCWSVLAIWMLLTVTAKDCQAEKLTRYESLQIRMGIPVKITLYAATEETANHAFKVAFDRFRDIDRCMSDYDPDSELMQLTRNAVVGEKMSVSHDLFTVLQASQSLSMQSEGAFDVTVGPVVKLWRIARRRKRLPDSEKLAAARLAVGFQKLQLFPDSRSVCFDQAGMQLDLGAIAKGYAADVALQAMQAAGVHRALIDAGGDIVAGDPPPDRGFWLIELEKLRSPGNEADPIPTVKIKNAAIATSGDAYQFLEIAGTRYSHIVNPHTGLGLTISSTVTVIAPTGMQADGLASAVSVLGPIKGLELIRQLEATQVFVVTLEHENEITEYVSEGFKKFLE